ncbi:MAG: molecular chaperone TorD family protein, partial [Thermodesulfovibrionales bacterium]|nr:molecular chaperone TorD family protein [Thermodesulfovibrionales bacterium]
ACFYLPEKDLFLKEGLLSNLTATLKQIFPDASVFSAAMEDNIKQYSDEDLAAEYAKLFVGPSELIAPPYGSVYLDEGRRVMGDSTMEVIKLYEEEGLGRDESFKELPDHVAVELEFMSFLIYKEIEAMERADSQAATQFRGKQEMFLDRFLSKWIPPFCQKIKEGTDNDFYKSLADCVFTFVAKTHLAIDIPGAGKK